MSVGKRVSDTIDKMEIGDPEGALFQICAAIDATAKTQFGKSGRGSYKDFIHENLGMITDIAFGGLKILNLNLGYEHPNLTLIYGLITAVVVSPANRDQHAPKEGIMNLGDFPIPINKLWGRRDELLWLLDATNEVKRIQTVGTAT